VRDRGDGGIADLETEGSDTRDTEGEELLDVLETHVEDLRVVDETVVVDDGGDKTVGEGEDVELGKEGGLRSTNTLTGLDEDLVGKDLDLTLVDLGGDAQSLEEGSLSGLHTSGTSRDNNVVGSNNTDLGRSSDLEGGDEVADLSKIALGEDEADVAVEVGEKVLDLGVLLKVVVDGTTDHGLLAHKKDSLATESNTDLLHVVAADVVALDKDDLGVLLDKGKELLEELSLLLKLGLRRHFECVLY